MRDVRFGVRFVRPCTLYMFIKILLSEQEKLVKKLQVYDTSYTFGMVLYVVITYWCTYL